ncbi:MAG TPA: DOMON domain-containing protein [Spirochaetota bacterium]|jgi:hypothetical protein|nr:MAG: DOMON domain protein [Spirochaetes bacterium ADurb.Bin133]HNZ26087.1 DOMON domain-containing protein [Spirochaetota bacterium]HOS34125.1 DOMON domain-containing protein [Spirochaetota bacterium]HOS56954.1 DOMON domain-containing protein [Spirochaetota bacterium]HPK63040.1 DOMON domain-containing protein [Spirochaetota bacterium]
MKKFLILTLILLSFSVAFSQDQDYAVVTKDDFTFSWRVVDGTMDIILEAPTTGWISVGFDPTKKMKDANYIIGSVDKNGEVTIQDNFGTGPISHKPDEKLGGVDNVANKFGEEKDGKTTLKFSIPLDSKDKFDVVLNPGKHTVILASSKSDKLTSKHNKLAKFEIEIK